MTDAETYFEALLAFLRRLEQENYRYRISLRPGGFALGVEVWVGLEVWSIGFSGQGGIDVEVFRSQGDCLREDDWRVLEGLFNRSLTAWRLAADDLQIEFVSPFLLRNAAGRAYECVGLLPHFGSEKGTLLVSASFWAVEGLSRAAQDAGYFVPALSPKYYNTYVREEFIDTLRDWGWHGPASDCPEWARREEAEGHEDGTISG